MACRLGERRHGRAATTLTRLRTRQGSGPPHSIPWLRPAFPLNSWQQTDGWHDPAVAAVTRHAPVAAKRHASSAPPWLLLRQLSLLGPASWCCSSHAGCPPAHLHGLPLLLPAELQRTGQNRPGHCPAPLASDHPAAGQHPCVTAAKPAGTRRCVSGGHTGWLPPYCTPA